MRISLMAATAAAVNLTQRTLTIDRFNPDATTGPSRDLPRQIRPGRNAAARVLGPGGDARSHASTSRTCAASP